MQRDAGVIEGVGLPPPADGGVRGAAAPRRPEVSHLVGVADSLRRELHAKDTELRSLQRGLDEKQRRLDESLASARAATAAQSRLQGENERLHREVLLLRSDKQALEAQLRDATAYSSKLESKLTANGKDYLLEQNLKLRQGNKALREELDAAGAASAAQRAELDRALREVETLAAALELRAAELGDGSDVHSGLLYEVAVRREEARRVTARLAEAESALASAEFELREIRISQERTAQDSEASANEAAGLRTQLDDVHMRLRECETRLDEAVRERDASLDFVAEQAARLESAQLRAESGDHAAEALQQRVRDAEADAAALSTQLGQLRTVLDVTQASLAEERSATQAALARASASDAALAQHRDALQACATELDAALAARSELQAMVGERAQDAVRLQAELEQLEELHRGAGDRLAEERETASRERSRLEREVHALREALDAVHAGQDAGAMRTRQLQAQVAAVEADRRALEASLGEARADADAARKAQSALRQVLALQQQRGGGGYVSSPESLRAASTAPTAMRAARPSPPGASSAAPPSARAAQPPAVSVLPEEAALLSPGTAALQAALRKARARREESASTRSAPLSAASSSSATASHGKGEPQRPGVRGGGSGGSGGSIDVNIDVAIAGLLEQLLQTDDKTTRSSKNKAAASEPATLQPLPPPYVAVPRRAAVASPGSPLASVRRGLGGSRSSTGVSGSSRSPAPQFSRFVAAPLPLKPAVAVRSSAAALSPPPLPLMNPIDLRTPPIMSEALIAAPIQAAVELAISSTAAQPYCVVGGSSDAAALQFSSDASFPVPSAFVAPAAPAPVVPSAPDTVVLASSAAAPAAPAAAAAASIEIEEKSHDVAPVAARADERGADASVRAAAIDATVPATPARGRAPSTSSIIARIESTTAANSTIRRRRGSSNRVGHGVESTNDHPSIVLATMSAPVSPLAVESRIVSAAESSDVPLDAVSLPSAPSVLQSGQLGPTLASITAELSQVAPQSITDSASAESLLSKPGAAAQSSAPIELVLSEAPAAEAKGGANSAPASQSHDSISLRISSFMSRLGPLSAGAPELPLTSRSSAPAPAPVAAGPVAATSDSSPAMTQGAAITYDEF